MKHLHLFIFLFFGCILVSNAAKINVQPNFKYLNSSHGLPQNTVLDIIQDSKGLMWFGTYDGLCRYDGKRLKVFAPELNNPYTINNGSINNIIECFSGLIYCTTEGGGLNVFDPHTEQFTVYLADSTPNSVVDNILYGMVQAKDSSIWITSYNGLSRFFPKTKSFKSYSFGEDRPYGYPNETSLSVNQDKQGQVWIGTYGSGLLRYTQEHDGFEIYTITDAYSNVLDANSIRDIDVYSPNELLLATIDGAFIFNTVSKKFSKFQNITGDLHNIIIDKKNTIWITSSKGGFYRLDGDDKTQYTRSIKNDKALQDDNVIAAYEDKDGNIWLGMRRFGVAYFNPNQQPFYHLYNQNTSQSLISNDLIVLENSSDSKVWVGTGKGISIWDYNKNSYSGIPNPKRAKHDVEEKVWALYNDTVRNKMWIGTPTGLFAYEYKSGNYIDLSYGSVDGGTVTGKPRTVEGVFCMTNDAKNQLWVGTYYGLFRYVENESYFLPYYAEDDSTGLSNNSIWSIYSDTEQNLWVGTAQGLCVYSFQEDRFYPYFDKDYDGLGLGDLLIYDMEEDGNGNLWLATPLGIHIINKNTGYYKYLGVDQGLPNNSVYTIEKYKDYMWASSNKGLTKISIQDHSMANYNATDGLQADEFSTNGLVLDNGMLMFGGIAGASVFYPDSIAQNKFIPELMFTELLFGDKLVYPRQTNNDYQALDSSLLYDNAIEVSYKEELIFVKFAALDFIANDKIQYRYRLKPLSEEWVDIGNKSSLTISNISPGQYTLEVQSTNAEQQWVANNKSLKIKVHPPFYKRAWFIVLSLVLLIVLVMYYVRIRTQRVNKQNHRLEEAVKDRTREVSAQKEEITAQRDKMAKQKLLVERSAEQLESAVLRRTRQLLEAKEKAEESDRLKSAFLANMSHEIRTPMNAIIGFSELLKYDDTSEEEKKQYVELVRTNSDSLMNLLNDILDISVIESGRITLHNETFLLEKFLDEIYQTFKNSKMLREKPDISLTSSYQFPQNLKLSIDKARLSQVMHNLLSNAIKYTNAGSINLFAKLNENELIIGVKDSGIGIKKEHYGVIFDRFYKADDEKSMAYRGGGLGLSISKNLIEFMGGTIWVESEYGKGSTFMISFAASFTQQ